MKNGTILFGILAVLFLFTACGAKEDIDNNISAENAVQIENSSSEESSASANETVPTLKELYSLSWGFRQSIYIYCSLF